MKRPGKVSPELDRTITKVRQPEVQELEELPSVTTPEEEPEAPEQLARAIGWRFTPLGDKLVVRPVAEGERKVGSLVIPDTAKERPSVGIVVALSRELFEGPDLAAGHRVVYGKYSGHELTIDDQAFIILRYQDILTILHEDTPQ